MDDLDRALLAFASLTYRHAGARDAAIRERFGLTPTAYHQRLLRIIDLPEAVTEMPVLVHRLRRQRDQRRPWHARRSA